MAKSIVPQFHVKNIVQLQVDRKSDVKGKRADLSTQRLIYNIQFLASAACGPLWDGQINRATIPCKEHSADASHHLHRDQNATNMTKDESTPIWLTIPSLSRLWSPIGWPNQSCHNSM